MARLALPRLLRLTAALLLVASSSMASSASADGMPATFAVPALREGDTWTYAITATPVAGGDSHLVQRSFTQQGASAARDADGRGVATARLVDLQAWMDGDRQEMHEWTYEVAADGTTVAATHLRDGGGAQATTTISGIPGQDTVVEDVREYPVVATTTHGPEPFCGHRSDLQGQRVSLRGVDLRGCGATGLFAPVASRDWNGAPAVVLGLVKAPESLQAWFTADVPVPVRIVDLRANASVVHELVVFAAGHADLTYGPALPDVAPVAFAPPGPFGGPDEAGVQHPFPLSAAYQAASAQGPLADFLASHEGSYLQSASYADLRVNQHAYTERQRIWTVVASDGATAEAARVTQTTLEGPGAVASASPVPIATPPQAPTVEEASTGEGPWPRPSAVPADLPTVASLMQRWQAMTSDPGPANAWGFRLVCAETCDAAKLQAWGGRDESTQPNEPQVGLATASIEHRDADLLAVDDNARIVWAETVDFARDYRLAGVPILATGNADEAPPILAVGPSADGSAIPWAGVAAAGAAVGAALLLAWLVKAGPLAGLFSRHIPDVTANPVRKALLDAIQGEPGIHHSELLRRVGKGNSVVTNHVRRLTAAGLVVERQGPRFRCYFPIGTARASLAAGPLVKSAVARGILSAVAQAPASGQDLALRLGVEPGAITYHVQRLSEAGLLTTRREGRFVLVEPTETGRQAAVA